MDLVFPVRHQECKHMSYIFVATEGMTCKRWLEKPATDSGERRNEIELAKLIETLSEGMRVQQAQRVKKGQATL